MSLKEKLRAKYEKWKTKYEEWKARENTRGKIEDGAPCSARALNVATLCFFPSTAIGTGFLMLVKADEFTVALANGASFALLLCLPVYIIAFFHLLNRAKDQNPALMNEANSENSADDPGQN